MVIAPHADDETLGAGGTLLRLQSEGAVLHWILMTTPEGSGYSDEYVRVHAQQVHSVNKAYGFDSLTRLEYPASSLSDQPLGAIVDGFRRLAGEFRPDTVLIPHSGDAHDDHAVTARAAWAAFKSFRMPSMGVRGLYSMEILSETGASVSGQLDPFRATTIVDISAFLERKLELFGLYRTEITEGGPRSISAVRAQAVLHGAEYGCAAAERFTCLQQII